MPDNITSPGFDASKTCSSLLSAIGKLCGEPLKVFTAIYKSKSRDVLGYEVEGIGRLDKRAAFSMAKSREFDNVVLVKRGTTKYLRSKPDQISGNNLRQVIIA
jgi:hypothetical protein